MVRELATASAAEDLLDVGTWSQLQEPAGRRDPYRYWRPCVAQSSKLALMSALGDRGTVARTVQPPAALRQGCSMWLRGMVAPVFRSSWEATAAEIALLSPFPGKFERGC